MLYRLHQLKLISISKRMGNMNILDAYSQLQREVWIMELEDGKRYSYFYNNSNDEGSQRVTPTLVKILTLLDSYASATITHVLHIYARPGTVSVKPYSKLWRTAIKKSDMPYMCIRSNKLGDCFWSKYTDNWHPCQCTCNPAACGNLPRYPRHNHSQDNTSNMS